MAAGTGFVDSRVFNGNTNRNTFVPARRRRRRRRLYLFFFFPPPGTHPSLVHFSLPPSPFFSPSTPSATREQRIIRIIRASTEPTARSTDFERDEWRRGTTRSRELGGRDRDAFQILEKLYSPVFDRAEFVITGRVGSAV